MSNWDELRTIERNCPSPVTDEWLDGYAAALAKTLLPSNHPWQQEQAEELEREQLIEELWDENIDFILALRKIAKEPNLCSAQQLAVAVLAKYSKLEEPAE